MQNREHTRQSLLDRSDRIKDLRALVGLDGFVDKIVRPVARRHGAGSDFTAIATIGEFGQRISSAAGRNANIESTFANDS